MNEKMKNLTVRTLSGAVIAAVVVLSIICSQWSFALLLGVLLVGGMLEFYSLAGKSGNNPQKLLGLAAGVVLFILNMALASENQAVYAAVGGLRGLFVCGLAFMLLVIPAMIVCELYRKSENPAAGIGTTLLGLFYVAMPVSLMCYIPTITGGGWNPGMMLSFVFIIWANDVFAYLVGMTVGRHKLFERLSPKKSWEGFFGGVVGAVAVGLLAGHLMEGDLWIWAGLGLVASVTGVLGDLAESMFKRSAGVKDSGSLIPGHGGVLDRFDALLLAAPFVFVYLLFVM